jgi:hypothetical protein
MTAAPAAAAPGTDSTVAVPLTGANAPWCTSREFA